MGQPDLHEHFNFRKLTGNCLSNFEVESSSYSIEDFLNTVKVGGLFQHGACSSRETCFVRASNGIEGIGDTRYSFELYMDTVRCIAVVLNDRGKQACLERMQGSLGL